MIGIISAVALSFIVHEPSGIMQCTIERSLFASLKMYLQSREEGRAGKGQTTVFERATPSRETAAAPQGFARREPRAGALRTTIATSGRRSDRERNKKRQRQISRRVGVGSSLTHP